MAELPIWQFEAVWLTQFPPVYLFWHKKVAIPAMARPLIREGIQHHI